MTETTDEQRKTGRGLVSITGAKLWFIVAGYAVQLVLPRVFTEEQFGDFSSAMNLASMVNNVLIAATLQTVSKLVSEEGADVPARLRQVLRYQLALGAVLFGAAFLAAPFVARELLLDAGHAVHLRAASPVILFYAVYAALVGTLNGQRTFHAQARLDMTFTTLRTAGILGAAGLGLGVIGALGGFATAAAGVLGVALFTVGVGKPGKGVPVAKWAALMAPLWFYQACLNGLMLIDQSVLKRLATQLHLDAGMGDEAAAIAAKPLVAYYRAVQTFAFVPYQLIMAVTLVVFPSVSHATSAGDAEKTREVIRGALRFSLLVLLALAAPMAGASDGVLRIAYPVEYLAGADALAVLLVGMVSLALFSIAAAALSGSGRPAIAAGIAAGALVVVLVACTTFIRLAGLDGPVLAAAAAGTATATTVALVAVGVVVWRTFGAFLPWRSVVRALLASAVGATVAHYVPHGSRLLALVALAAGCAAYGLVLVVTRELGPAELARVRAIVARRAPR